jgi:hypothetical protein
MTALAGAAVAAGVATTPLAMLDPVMGVVGLGGAAGSFGRATLAILAGGTIAGSGVAIQGWRTVVGWARRRANAHPDAPACRPIRASEDLGRPLALTFHGGTEPARSEVLSPEADRDLPLDLDTPLSTFDPGAMLAQPLAPAVAVPSLTGRPAVLAPGERFDSYALTPPVPARERVVPSPEQSIALLRARLDRRRRPRLPATNLHERPSVDETLQRLRQLAGG